MTTVQIVPHSLLYESDETAWLELTAELIRAGRLNELDYPHLSEYLTDMARRDRREVLSRLTVLIAHLLKWTYQSERRSNGWRTTIVTQRQELDGLLESGVLRNHAVEVLPKAYAYAMEVMAATSQLPEAREWMHAFLEKRKPNWDSSGRGRS